MFYIFTKTFLKYFKILFMNNFEDFLKFLYEFYINFSKVSVSKFLLNVPIQIKFTLRKLL